MHRSVVLRLGALALLVSTLSASRPEQAAAPAWTLRAELRGLEEPAGLAFGRDGAIYVSEASADRIAVLDGRGRIVRRFGARGAAPGLLDRPHGIAVGEEGSLYVADTGNDRIQVFSPGGTLLRTWGRSGSGPGEFREPLGIAVDGKRAYVAEAQNARVQVFDLAGNLVFYVWSHGHTPGKLGRPVDVAVDPEGSFYVSDADNCRVQEYDAQGRFVAGWGDRGARSGLLSEPGAIALVRGEILVADTNNQRVEAIDAAGEFRTLWDASSARGGRGSALARFRPTQIAVAPSGATRVLCDAFQDRCLLEGRTDARDPIAAAPSRSVPPPHFGSASSLAGNALLVQNRSTEEMVLLDLSKQPPSRTALFGGGGFEVSELVRPSGAHLDPSGALLVSDPGSRRLVFYRTAPGALSGARFTRALLFDPEALSLAPEGWSLDPLEVRPGAVARDRLGTLFVADLAAFRIVVLDPKLRATRSWGGRGDEDGRFLEPADVAWSEAAQALYVVDAMRGRVQGFDAQGKLLYAWGRRGSEFEQPSGLAVDRAGNVYVVDRRTRRVQKFARDGRPLGAWSVTGDRGGGTAKPERIHVDERGQVIVIDPGADRIRVFTPQGKQVASFGPEVLTTPPTPASPAPAASAPAPQPAASDGWSPLLRSNEGTYSVRFRTDPSPIPLNEPFSMEVQVFDSEDPPSHAHALSLEVEARMPAHRHGMTRVPKVRAVWDVPPAEPMATLVREDPALGDGRYDVRGMLFHMPGSWEIDFDLTRWGRTERAEAELSLD